MYASVIVLKMKPGSKDDIVALIDGMTDELRKIGCKRFQIIEHEDDRYTTIVQYTSKEDWESAAPKAAELLGRLGPYATEKPVRLGGDVITSIDF